MSDRGGLIVATDVSSAGGDWRIIAGFDARVPLAGAADLLVLVAQKFLPVSQPADGTRNGKQDGEHRDRETHGLVDQA